MSTQSTTYPHIRECTNPKCMFRFPVTAFDKNFEFCPKCKSPTTHVIDIHQPAIKKEDAQPEIKVSFLLDNLRSVFNVGSIFRSADGCGVIEHLYLCGTTPTPEHPKMTKTALGAEKSINWSYHLNGYNLAQQLVAEGKKLIALELTETSTKISDFLNEGITENMVFIVGNEVTGVDPEILAIANDHIHLPMYGIKESLNVAIAASILCYSL